MPDDEYDNTKKAHVKRKSGKKAEKKKGKEGHEQVRGVIIWSDERNSHGRFTGNDCKAAKSKGVCSAEHHKDRAKSEKEG